MGNRFVRFCLGSIGLALMLGSQVVAGQPKPPDLTQGEKKDGTPDWNLGPTGAKGWVYCKGFSTAESRQILVGQVDKGSPADGVLAAGDVILGVNGKPFDSDARRAFAEAITEAEKAENKGVLKLLRWRREKGREKEEEAAAQLGDKRPHYGKQDEVTIQLRVMGTYSETSPINCEKAKKIVEEGCRAIVKRGLSTDIPGNINALALLASGNPEYLDVVKTYARKLGPPDLKLKLEEGMHAWTWGYANLFLTEYYLATNDATVLPAIREYAVNMARGQSSVGTYGHGFVVEKNHGTLGGYGAINQAGLICWMSMALAQKCGIDDPDLKKGVATSQRFFSFYVNKGPIPYGDHPPYFILHDDNGKSGSAAMTFDILGDKAGAQFFSRMATAAYGEKENGHTGNYFSFLWGALGVNRAGPEAAAAYLKELRWYYDLARRWDGSFFTISRDNYDWDMTGLFVLHYALPLQKLTITGKGVSKENRLTGAELQEVLECGRSYSYGHDHDCDNAKSVEALLKGLASWSPTVRYRSAMALSKKPDDVVPQLLGMLKGNDMNARYGACQALEYLEARAAPATDELIQQLSADDMWLKIRASFALSCIGPPARRAVPVLLKLAMTEDKNDPRNTLCRYLAFALFKTEYVDNTPRRNGLLADSLEGVDRAALYPVIKRMLAIDDGLCRMTVRSALNRLNLQELDPLWPEIMQAVKVDAPSGEMFANEIRLAGIKLLAKNHIQDGMQAIADYARNQTDWGSENRTPILMAELKTYGAAARDVVPALQDLVAVWKSKRDFPDNCNKKRIAAVEEAIKAIEEAKDQPQLRSISRLLPKADVNR
ncbi:MAG: DUF6288 domain-containing protein [Planctomycetota bacterium]|nr:DUF6288 domain-containing protein [Planctomycetota bacterium]